MTSGTLSTPHAPKRESFLRGWWEGGEPQGCLLLILVFAGIILLAAYVWPRISSPTYITLTDHAPEIWYVELRWFRPTRRLPIEWREFETAFGDPYYAWCIKQEDGIWWLLFPGNEYQ